MTKIVTELVSWHRNGQGCSGLSPTLRSLNAEIQTQKTVLFTEALQLNDADGAVFWPLYREFETKQAAIYDRYVALIKEYAASYENMIHAKAKEIAARWLQLERTVSNLLLLQAQTELPLIP